MPGPLGKEFLKDNPIKCQFHNGTESVQGWVIRKIGSSKFRCQDEKGNTAICHLVPHEVRQMSSLKPGEMIINVKLKDGTLVQVSHLKKKMMKIVSSDSKYNQTYQPWSFDTNPGFAPPTPSAAATPKPKPSLEKFKEDYEKPKEESFMDKVKKVAKLDESSGTKMEAQIEEDKL